MTLDELHGLASFFPWPKGVKLRLPCNNGGSLANYPSCIVLYEDFITAGFRLPLHPFICDFLSDTKLCPAQLAPNAWRNILAFLLKFKDLDRPPSYEAFKCMYNIRPLKDTYSLYFKGVDLITTPRIVHSWGRKWFLVSQSEAYEFNFPMYPSSRRFVKSVAMKGTKYVDSEVEDLIQSFKALPGGPGLNDYNKVLDAPRLEDAGLSLPHPVVGPVELYEKYISKRKREIGSSEAELKNLESSSKRVKTCARERPMVLRNNPGIEDESEEEPEEEEEEEETRSSISTLSMPDISTALKRLPEIIQVAQRCEEVERELKESRRENVELKRENGELRRREMKMADELERTKIEFQKTAKEQLMDKSKIIEATQKAKEFLELSSSIFKTKR